MSGNINKNREAAQDLKNSVKTGSIHGAKDVTERKMAENFLRESEERYRLIVEGVNIIGWEYDPSKDCFTFVSGKAQEITGYTPKQWREKGFWASHIHPKDRDFTIKYCKNATKRGEDHEFEYRMITADGGFIWFRDIVQVVFNNGKVAGLRGIFIDVTEKKKMEEMLQKQKEALEQKNIALREVLGQVELEKKQVKDNVIANTENLLLPILEKLRLKGESRKYVNLLRKSLQELTSSFGAKLTEKEAKLTSREIEICNMIKNGLASVEIADLLNISLRTIEKHRANIRKKLGITKKEANLTSFLKTL